MEQEHEPGCNGQHTLRQRCSVPYANDSEPITGGAPPPRILSAVGTEWNTTHPVQRVAPDVSERSWIAVPLEAFPGVLFLLLYGLAAKSWLSGESALLLGLLTVISGGGWYAIGRIGTGCFVTLTRLGLAVFVLFQLFEGFTNESTCYARSDFGDCYWNAIRWYDVGLVAYIVFPFASTILLLFAIRGSPWRSIGLRPFETDRAIRVLLRLIGALALLLAVPLILGVGYSRTGYGRSTLIVQNATGLEMSVFYRPGHGEGATLSPDEIKKLQPQFDRFDDPREVTFVAYRGDIATYWTCEWSFAKEQEPIKIDFGNSAGCDMHDANLRSAPTPIPSPILP